MLQNVAHQQQALLHRTEVTHGLPAHRLVDVKQCPLPPLESWVIGHFLANALPSPLQLGQDGLFVTAGLGIKTRDLALPLADVVADWDALG